MPFKESLLCASDLRVLSQSLETVVNIHIFHAAKPVLHKIKLFAQDCPQVRSENLTLNWAFSRFIYLRERKRMYEQACEWGYRQRERICKQTPPVSAEPQEGLYPATREIMT